MNKKDIANLNFVALAGLRYPAILDQNEKAYKLINSICWNHHPGERFEEIKMIFADLKSKILKGE